MSDAPIIIIYSLILFVSITLNIILLTLIVLVTPKSNKNLSIFMAHTVFDIIITLSTFSNMGRILVISSHIVWIMHGPCGLISTRFCYLAFDGYLTGVSAVFYINMVSFLARLIYLRNNSISKRKVFLLLLILVAPHVIVLMIIFSTAQIADSQARKLVDENLPIYAHETTIIASDHVLSPPIAYTLCYICVVIYPAMFGLWKLRATTIAELDNQGQRISSATKIMHHTFIKIMTYQAMVPLIFVLSSLMFIIVQFLEWRQPAAESIPMMIGEAPAIISAIISITFFPAYRRYLYRVIFGRPYPYDCTRMSSHTSIQMNSLTTARENRPESSPLIRIEASIAECSL